MEGGFVGFEPLKCFKCLSKNCCINILGFLSKMPRLYIGSDPSFSRTTQYLVTVVCLSLTPSLSHSPPVIFIFICPHVIRAGWAHCVSLGNSPQRSLYKHGSHELSLGFSILPTTGLFQSTGISRCRSRTMTDAQTTEEFDTRKTTIFRLNITPCKRRLVYSI